MKKIIIYYHVAGFGLYESIFQEQISLLKSSGLYDKCEEIRISFLGKEGALDRYIEDKLKIVYFSENIKEFEIPTINKLFLDSTQMDEEYYILYIHTKGCSNLKGVKGQYYWRQMMNYWMITRHEDCLTALDGNFSTCGINSMPRKNPNHYSGNFWWANSGYIKKLSAVKNNKFTAPEYWVINHDQTKNHHHISLFGPYIPSNRSPEGHSGLYSTIMRERDYDYFNINIF
jgi:hypothetical protein